MLTKKEIRESVSARRHAMGERQVILASQAIIDMLQGSDIYKKANSIFFYCSIKEEVYTHGAIASALSAGKTVILPRSNVKSLTLELYKIHSISELVKGAYGILEPIPDKARQVQVSDIDLVIVPGVAFDKLGNRIGLGLGYYDRLLSGMVDTGRVCALAYSFQIVPEMEIPHDSHDVPMDYLISEDHVIDCMGFRKRAKKPASKVRGKKA
ncbi:MAG: 5-formyltetrahydrofolate cyclo-ligase [Candidatus Micrarchaeia archaeon]